jgi:hypothetical protein
MRNKRSIAKLSCYPQKGKSCLYDLDNEILSNPLAERINSSDQRYLGVAPVPCRELLPSIVAQ